MSGHTKYCQYCGAAQERDLGVDTAASLFDLTPGAVRAMLKRRELTFYKLGSRTRIAYSEMVGLLEEHPSAQKTFEHLTSSKQISKLDTNGNEKTKGKVYR